MLNMVLLVKGSTETSLVKVTVYYVRFLHRLLKKNGAAYTAKYLKASVSLLMQAISGEPHISTRPLGLAVSRTRGGLPRFIPAVHRAHIKQGNLFYIRLWLSLISIYRVFDFVGKLSLSTIIAPNTAKIDFNEIIDVVDNNQTLKIMENLKDFSKEDVNFVRPFWISSSSPTSIQGKKEKSTNEIHVPKTVSSATGSLVAAAYAWAHNPELRRTWIKLANEMFAIGHVTVFMKSIKSKVSDYKLPFEVHTQWTNPQGTVNKLRSTFKAPPALGKLAFKPEPAGKIRVFAMVDAFTQWLLRPLHDRLFDLLRTIKTDATFDQVPTVRRFAERVKSMGIRKIYSFDLTAATDRIPIQVQSEILSLVYGIDFGDAWADLLVKRWYDVPFPSWDPSAVLAKRLGLDPDNLPENVKGVKHLWKHGKQTFVTAVRYGTGQPMGALSSWAMLAVSHHVMVAIAAARVGLKDFDLYLILGDDLVIADSRVAKAYLKLASEWEIGINLSKSVISANGSFEFAKRFFYKYQEVSGLSFKEMAVARFDVRALFQILERIKDFRDIRVSEMLSFLGHGYKALSRITAKYSQMGGGMRRALLLASYPGSLFSQLSRYEDWLGSVGFNRPFLTVFGKESRALLAQYLLAKCRTLDKFVFKYGGMELELLEVLGIERKEYRLGHNPFESRSSVPQRFRKANPFVNLLSQLALEQEEKLFEQITETWEQAKALSASLGFRLDDLWKFVDRVERLIALCGQGNPFTVTKDIETLGKSKILKKASFIRQTLTRFAKENK